VSDPQPSRDGGRSVTEDRSVAIVGLGYVGLRLALAFQRTGHAVVGVDADTSRVASVRGGQSPIEDVSDDELASALSSGLSVSTADDSDLAAFDAIFVCVPTPLTASREPDLRAVVSAARLVGRAVRPGQLVTLQSTTWPGTTAGPFREALEESGFEAGRDFSLAYAPERINPGDPSSLTSAVPRLVGGLTPHDTDRAANLLRRLGGTVHKLSSPDAAELAKLLDNVFRNVNIALVNQLALLTEKMGLDVWEVVDAAATKPFGFMPFRPGPGVGGHCIPVDPYYLSWRARQFGLTDRFVELAGDINSRMPTHVVDLAARALNEVGKPVKGSSIGVIGVAFKADVSDTRNAPSAAVMADLRRGGASVSYHDPHVPEFTDSAGNTYRSMDMEHIVDDSDLIVVMVGHAIVDWSRLYSAAKVVVDTVNRSSRCSVRAGRVLRLGAGWV
jgi:UDP-N-acetyl-D-glucosamine dehydrogenase